MIRVAAATTADAHRIIRLGNKCHLMERVRYLVATDRHMNIRLNLCDATESVLKARSNSCTSNHGDQYLALAINGLTLCSSTPNYHKTTVNFSGSLAANNQNVATLSRLTVINDTGLDLSNILLSYLGFLRRHSTI